MKSKLFIDTFSYLVKECYPPFLDWRVVLVW